MAQQVLRLLSDQLSRTHKPTFAIMASSQQIATINQAAPDGGLKQVFETAKLNPAIVKILLEEEEVSNLAEFSSFFTKDGYEDEAVTLRDRVETLKTKQVEVARIRTAVLLARGVLAQPAPIEQSPAKTHRSTWRPPLTQGPRKRCWRVGTSVTASSSPCISTQRILSLIDSTLSSARTLRH